MYKVVKLPRQLGLFSDVCLIKDRQQEAEPDSQYLLLFCNYFMLNNILYMKLKVILFYTWPYILHYDYPCFSENMNLKPFLSLLFFEHGYFSYYSSFRLEMF